MDNIHQTVEERRAYVNQVRASFQASGSQAALHNTNGFHTVTDSSGEEAQGEFPPSTLGIRTIIAILIFAAFVYCDQEKITYQNYTTKEVFSQIEWNPLPIDEMLEKVEKQQ